MIKLSGVIREINSKTYNDFKTLGYLNSDVVSLSEVVDMYLEL